MNDLDSQVRRFLENLADRAVPPYHLQTVEQARLSLLDQIKSMTNTIHIWQVTDLRADGPAGPIPIRLYRPSAGDALPLIVYFHGGGWVLGNIETHDSIARQLSSSTGFAVASVDYRLAPEHPFPAAVEDAYASLQWLAGRASQLNVDRRRIAVCGDSAGGNLAAVISILARDYGGPQIALQILRYPCVDFGFDTGSYKAFATGYQLSKADMEWYRRLYLSSRDEWTHPHAAPIHAPDLSGLPPAIVVTAEFDVLRDEGRAYADRLRDSGVDVTYRCFEGLIHGFFGMTASIDKASMAARDLASLIQDALMLQPQKQVTRRKR